MFAVPSIIKFLILSETGSDDLLKDSLVQWCSCTSLYLKKFSLCFPIPSDDNKNFQYYSSSTNAYTADFLGVTCLTPVRPANYLVFPVILQGVLQTFQVAYSQSRL